MLLQVFYVCVAFQEPEQLVDDRLEMEFLGGQQRKTVFEVILYGRLSQYLLSGYD